eukprot:scaffold75472_cov71-Cyclotella_meneghiniana.AAC.1
MRHWDGPAAVVWMSWSTQSLIPWPCSLGDTRQLFPLKEDKIQPVETLVGNTFQSKPHIIIQYIHNETLGWSSSSGMDVMVHTVTDLALRLAHLGPLKMNAYTYYVPRRCRESSSSISHLMSTIYPSLLADDQKTRDDAKTTLINHDELHQQRRLSLNNQPEIAIAPA